MRVCDIANQLKAVAVWLCRIGHCRGFGIQSPSDYWLVRYVINEHWPYYQYATLGRDDDWLTRKLGRLLFRIANWRQPSVIESSAYREYLQAGCRKAILGESSELMVLPLDGDCRSRLSYIYIIRCRLILCLLSPALVKPETYGMRLSQTNGLSLLSTSITAVLCCLTRKETKRTIL